MQGVSLQYGLREGKEGRYLPRKNEEVHLQMFAVTPPMKAKQLERKMFSVYWPFSYRVWEKEGGARNASPVQQYLCAIRNAA